MNSHTASVLDRKFLYVQQGTSIILKVCQILGDFRSCQLKENKNQEWDGILQTKAPSTTHRIRSSARLTPGSIVSPSRSGNEQGEETDGVRRVKRQTVVGIPLCWPRFTHPHSRRSRHFFGQSQTLLCCGSHLLFRRPKQSRRDHVQVDVTHLDQIPQSRSRSCPRCECSQDAAVPFR